MIHSWCVGPGFVCAVLAGFVTLGLGAAEKPVADKTADEMLRQAGVSFAKGNREEAIELATKAIEAEPKSAKAYYVRGRFYAEVKRADKAMKDFNQALGLDAGIAPAYYYRAAEHFKLGAIQESAADFDKFVELAPEQAPKLWQRGISLYYAGRYEDGRRQFELHQTINSNDVENAVWHFLCVARRAGIDKARASLLKVENDPRVPMSQIYALYAGKGSAEDVLKTATSGKPSPNELNERLFYSHLYLGLYFDVAGNEKMAREHIVSASELFKVDSYMGDVARVHAGLMRQRGH
jgi:lipoprotein NlpI